jgi:hypothetical protein
MPSLVLERPPTIPSLGQLDLRREIEGAFTAIRGFIESSKADVVLLRAVDSRPVVTLRTGRADELSWTSVAVGLFPDARSLTQVEREAYRDFRLRRALKKK